MRMRAPGAVRRWSHFIIATGGRPMLRRTERKLLRGPFHVALTVTDNAVVDQSLMTASLHDFRVQNFYGSAAVALKAVINVEGFEVLINDADFRGETEALRESFSNLGYIFAQRAARSYKWPIRDHIREGISQFEFHEAANTAVERSILAGFPWMFEEPVRLDMEVDTLSYKQDTAVNFASGNIVGYVVLHGHMAPKNYPGTGVLEVDCNPNPNDMEAQFDSLDPVAYGGLLSTPAGKPFALGASAPQMTLG